ncbi:hypothetical protein G9A89_003573 [Geosiphon pyriformis]|nr:hypothetical protein G9A89_003573 [Geosiphon pyriformis]
MEMSNATETVISTILKHCDWRIEIYNCQNSGFWTTEVVFSLVTFGMLTLSGLFIFAYRFRYMWQGLFVEHGGVGIRPLPVDCLLLFFTIAALLRTGHCVFLLLDLYTMFWQRELGQELAATFLSFGSVTYLVGIIYTIPVSYTYGTSGIVSLGSSAEKSSLNLKSHKLFIPTPVQLNVCLAFWCFWPSLIALPCAILSGISRDQGNLIAAEKFITAKYALDFVFSMSFSIITAYYGVNFIIILQSTMRKFERNSVAFGRLQSKLTPNPTRKAFYRLKYTMTYLFFMFAFTGPCWLLWGISHQQIVSTVNGLNIFLSIMWYITGPQGMIAVCQYLLAKRIYQITFSDGHPSSISSVQTQLTYADLTNPHTPTTPSMIKPAVIKVDNRVDIEIRTVDNYSSETNNHWGMTMPDFSDTVPYHSSV